MACRAFTMYQACIKREVEWEARYGAACASNNSPPSVSCHTMPSSVTDVPGSQGPRQSGSVIVPTEVPTHTSAVSWNKQRAIIRHCSHKNPNKRGLWSLHSILFIKPPLKIKDLLLKTVNVNKMPESFKDYKDEDNLKTVKTFEFLADSLKINVLAR